MRFSFSTVSLCVVALRGANALIGCDVSFTSDEDFSGLYIYRNVTYNNFVDLSTYLRDDESALLVHLDISSRRRLQSGEGLESSVHKVLLDGYGPAESPEPNNMVRSRASSIAAALEEVRDGARRAEECRTEAWYFFLLDADHNLLKDTYYATPDCAVVPNDISGPWIMLNDTSTEGTQLADGDVEISCFETTYAPTSSPTSAPTYAPIAA